MCLSPIKIFNNSKTLFLSQQPKLINYVKCGKCYECEIDIRNEWMCRSYYHAKETISKNGFCIFDTLTYSEDNCPWSRDIIMKEYGLDIGEENNFRCMNYRDVQLFLKRLRKKLYKGDKLSYYIASEYGTKEKRTHRPHYHCIFFVQSKYNPIEFSKMIKKSWSLGLTDGVDDKGIIYFKEKRLFYNNDAVINSMGYVNKYMSKDSVYSKLMKIKTKEIVRIFFEKNPLLKDTTYGNICKNKILRSLNQFHKQSHGFGISALNELKVENLINDNKILIPDRENITKRIKLPMYYYRKLFKRFDTNSKSWIDNEYTKEYKIKRLLESQEIIKKNILLNIDNEYIKYSEKEKEYLNQIKFLFNGRSVDDYIKYCLIYKDRAYGKNDRSLNPIRKYTFEEYVNNIDTKKDFVYQLITNKDFDTNLERYVIFYDSIENNHLSVKKYKKFLSEHIINDKINVRFKDFDKIFDLFYKLNNRINLLKQNAYYKKLELKKQYQVKN